MEENLPANQYSNKNHVSFLPMIFLLIIGGFFSFIIGILAVPQLLQTLTQTVVNANPKIFWYISRGSGIIAYIFMWFSMLLGLLMSTKLISRGYSLKITNELHKFISLFGLFFILLHAIILVADEYMQIALWQIFIPFTVFSYRPLNIGAGQIVFYLWAVLLLSYNFRKQIGHHTWRIIHYLSFASFWLVLLHGITSGTDSGTFGMNLLYWTSAASTIFLIIYRIMLSIFKR